MDDCFIGKAKNTGSPFYLRTPKVFLLSVCYVLFCLLPAISFSQSIRLWSTYYGGGGDELNKACVATDNAGNVYLAGTTNSGTGIASLSPPGFQTTIGIGGVDSTDAFLVKFDANGTRIWATYYGGPGDEKGLSVATDGQGNVYLAGSTNSNIGIASPSPPGFQTTMGGGNDAFLVKFDASGNRIWATYYGGSADETGTSIATDTQGNIYLAGNTQSISGIASSGAVQVSSGGVQDAFLVKFNPSGIRQWATYYGGLNTETAQDVATDSVGNVFITGSTNSINFPLMNLSGAHYQSAIGGGFDAFVVRFNTTGTLLWATYYGGAATENGFSIATDAANNVFLAGATNSSVNIATPLGFKNSYGGGGANDAFLVKFSPVGVRLWGTYYGDIMADIGYSVAADAAGNVYLAGHTNSSSGISSNGFQNIYGQGLDNFLVQFNGAGNRLCATYFGGTQYEGDQNGIAISNGGEIYMAGHTGSVSGIASPVSFQNSYGGGTGDAYLAKLFNLSVSVSSTKTCSNPCNGTATASATGGSPPYTYSWTPGVQATKTATGLCAGTYAVTVVDSIGGFGTTTVNIAPFPAFSANVSANAPTICACTGSLTATFAGGVAPYSYSWNTSPVQTTATATGLCGGAYNVTIKDSNSCIATASKSILQNSVTITSISPPAPTLCSGSSATIQVTAQGPGTLTYSWKPGNMTGAVVFVTPTSSTTYTVTASNSSCSATGSVVVTVLQTPTVSISGNASICHGGQTTLTASGGSSSTNYSYSWNTGDSDSSIVVTPTGNTLYTVTVSVGNMCKRTKSFNVNVSSVNATINATEDTICIGETSVLNTVSSATSYLWSTGATAPSISVTPTNPTTYFVTITNAAGCKGSDTIYITVNPTPTVSISGNTTICTGLLNFTTLTAITSGTMDSYSWSPTYGLNNPTISNPMAIYFATSPNSITYTVTVTDSLGCKGANTKLIIIKPPPYLPPVVASPSYCIGDSILPIIATPNPSTAGIAWFNSAYSLLTINDTLKPLQSLSQIAGTTIYNVVQGIPGCVSAHTQVSLTINPLPIINASPDDTIICPGSSAQLRANALAGSPPYTHLWSPGNLLNDSIAAYPSATPDDSIATFYVWVSDSKGCRALDSVLVEVVNSENCGKEICDGIYNGITPNGDGFNDTWLINSILLFPENAVSIFNRWGVKVWSTSRYNNKDIIWNGDSDRGEKLPNGTYYYVIDLNWQDRQPCKGWIEVTY